MSGDYSSAQFLWKYRERPSSTKRLLVLWIKRAYHVFPLLWLLLRPVLLRFQGARIGSVTALGSAQFEGSKYRLQVGSFSSIGRCRVVLHDEVRIGRCVVISDGAKLLTASHDVRSNHWERVTAPIVVGDYAWIAMDAIILPGVRIGIGAVVAAGAVVAKDVPDYAVAFGNPAHLRQGVRVASLDYQPTLLNAPYEAWVGRMKDRFQGEFSLRRSQRDQ